MEEQPQKTEEQATVRIYKPTKARLQKVVRKLTGNGDRKFSEVEVVDEILKAGLKRHEKNLGINP